MRTDPEALSRRSLTISIPNTDHQPMLELQHDKPTMTVSRQVHGRTPFSRYVFALTFTTSQSSLLVSLAKFKPPRMTTGAVSALAPIRSGVPIVSSKVNLGFCDPEISLHAAVWRRVVCAGFSVRPSKYGGASSALHLSLALR